MRRVITVPLSIMLLTFSGCASAPEEVTTDNPPRETPTSVPPGENPTSQPTGQTPTDIPVGQSPTGQPTGQSPTDDPPKETPTSVPPGETPTDIPPGESSAPSFASFGTVTLEPNWDVDGAGKNVDSIAFWVAPNTAESLMFVTAKENQLVEVWRYPFDGSELSPLTHSSFASDSQVNGVVVDQQTDRLYVAVGSPKSAVVVFSLPALTYLDEFRVGSGELGSEPNLAFLPSTAGGTLYVSSSTQVYLFDAATNEATGTFTPEKGLETIVADAHHQALYIPDESDRTGVYAYTLSGEPDARAGSNIFGDTVFGADAEGILLYTCPATGGGDDGRGLIVVSDQLQELTEFEVFDRQTREHLGALRLTGVSNTDGIGSTQQPLPMYPLGVFAAVNDDSSVAGIGWDSILEATGISCG